MATWKGWLFASYDNRPGDDELLKRLKQIYKENKKLT
jgi:hypothetical protein